MALFKAELIERQTRLSKGDTYYAVKFTTGSCSFMMQMTDYTYNVLLQELAGDPDSERGERPHDSEIMKDFLSMVFEIGEDDG